MIRNTLVPREGQETYAFPKDEMQETRKDLAGAVSAVMDINQLLYLSGPHRAPRELWQFLQNNAVRASLHTAIDLLLSESCLRQDKLFFAMVQQDEAEKGDTGESD